MTGWRRALILAGVAAPIVLGVVVVLVGSADPTYHHRSRAISDLGASGAPLAVFMNSFGFILTGFLIAAFAFSFVAVEGPGVASVVASVSWILAGCCFASLGVWPFPHPYHLEFALYCIVFSVLGVVAGTWALTDAIHSAWLWASFALAVLASLDMIVVPFRARGTFGHGQRIHLGLLGLWLVVAAVHLYAIQARRGSRRAFYRE